jgi:hypothetical protein
VSTTTEQVKYTNVHMVSRTTEQVKYTNVHLVSTTTLFQTPYVHWCI